MDSKSKGFTLIELMIVVAIIGMVAAVGIPSYLDYIAKSQASEAVALTTALKAPISEYYSSNGRLPTLSETGGQINGKYVQNVTIFTTATNVVVQATFKPAGVSVNIANQTFAITSDASLANWQCGLSGTDSAAHTTVEFNYLPTACR